MRNILTIIFFTIFIFSCQVDKVEISGWNPDLVIPLIDATITISDLIPEKGSTKYDDDNFIRLAVRNDELYTVNAESFIDLPSLDFSQNFELENFPITEIYIDTVINIEQLLISNPSFVEFIPGIDTVPFPPNTQIPAGQFTLLDLLLGSDFTFDLEEFSSASFNEGTLEVTIHNNLPINITNLQITLSTGLGSLGLIEFNDLNSFQSQTSVIDLNSQSIDNNVSFDIINFSTDQSNPLQMVDLTSETGIGISFGLIDINVNNIAMTFQNQEIESDTTFIDFNLSSDEQIHNIKLLEGNLFYEISSSLITPLDLKLGIGTNFEVLESIELNGGTINGSIDLANLDVDLTTDSEQPYNRLPVAFNAIINSDNIVTLSSGDYINISCSFMDLELDYLYGRFVDYEIPLEGDTVDVDLALFEDFDSGLVLEEPRFSINIVNSLGLSARIDGELIAFSQNGNSQAGFYVDSIIESPQFIGEEINMSWTYGENIIGDIIALPPHIIEYSATAFILESDQLNFISGESQLTLGVDIDFPLSLNAANISLRDTVDFEEIKFDLSNIDELILHFNLINGFPLGTEFNLVLHDSVSNLNLDTLSFTRFNSEDNTIEGAIVDNEGYVTTTQLNSGAIILSSLEISNLLNSNKLLIDITLSTSSNSIENQYVKLYADYEFVVKMGIQTRLNVN